MRDGQVSNSAQVDGDTEVMRHSGNHQMSVCRTALFITCWYTAHMRGSVAEWLVVTSQSPQHLDVFVPATPNPGSRTRPQPAIDHYGAVSTFHDDDICETRLSMLCTSCLEQRVILSGARCRLAYCPADATATHCLLLQ